MLLLTNWKPTLRNIIFQEKPDWVPEWVYTEALAAKRYYNAGWEFWVYDVSRTNNVSQDKAELACARGIVTSINQLDYIYGSKLAKWFKEFLEMDGILDKIKHPEYRDIKLESENK